MRAVLPLLLLNVRPVPFAGVPRLSVPSLTPASLSAPALSPSLAPSLVLAPAPALAPLAAPQDAPQAPQAPDPAKPALDAAAPAPAPAPDAPAERQAAEAGARFDGSVEIVGPPAPVLAPLPKPVDAAPGWTIQTVKAEDAEWLGDVMAALRGSKTGRRILEEVDAIAAARRRPVLVDVARISNNAEVRYDSGLLVMDKNHRRKVPWQAAPILAHELQHVLQKMYDFIPVDALEMEIESYTVEARVWNELGLKPPPNSFARNAKGRLERDPDAFFTWLADEYKKNRMLHGSTMESYVEWLELEREKTRKRIAGAQKRIKTAERVLESMRAAGAPEAQVDAHRHDDLHPAEAGLREHGLTLAWIERDLLLLSTPEGRKRFRDYSRGVIRRARAMLRG